MSEIKRVPIEELAEHLEGTKQIAVEKDGRIVGFYIPREHPPAPPAFKDLDWSNTDPEARKLAQKLRQTLQEIYAETGMTEDEFADLMNPKFEFPYDRLDGKKQS